MDVHVTEGDVGQGEGQDGPGSHRLEQGGLGEGQPPLVVQRDEASSRHDRVQLGLNACLQQRGLRISLIP